jgi:hypothetical protein
MKLEFGVDDAFRSEAAPSVIQPEPQLEPQISKEHDETYVANPKDKGKTVTFVETVASSVNRDGFSTYTKSVILSAISPSVRKGLEHMDVPPPPILAPENTESICPYCSLPIGREMLGKDKLIHWR